MLVSRELFGKDSRCLNKPHAAHYCSRRARVTFSVRVLGTTPLGFRWRLGGVTLVPYGQGTATLTITNVQLSQANSYEVTITNIANTSPGVQSSAAVLTPSSEASLSSAPYRSG